MKITKIISSQIGTVKGRVQTKKANFPDVSFKKRTDATADDSNISWGGILTAAAAVFVLVSAAGFAIKKLMGRYTQNAKAFVKPQKIQNANLKLDAVHLRELPIELKREIKEALNRAVTHDEYQKVLRDYGVGI